MANRYRYEARFSRGRQIKYLSHLDMMRLWERTLRRAQLPLVYSEGFNPRPRLSFAAPLPVGVLAQDDVAEFHLADNVPCREIIARANAQAVAGLELHQVTPVPQQRSESLQARMREALYEVRVAGHTSQEMQRAVQELLASESVPMQHRKRGRLREYNLRPLVLALSLASGPRMILHMRLRHDSEKTGRPADVLQALGVDPAECEITRTALVLADKQRSPEG